jgi:hypothetical protein
MNFSRSILLSVSLFFGMCTHLFAQSKTCENAIKNKYSGEYQDRYGNGTSRKISMMQYYATHGPGMHKFGNNNALLYLAVVDKYENGQIRDRDTVKVWCVVNAKGNVLGLERDFN